MRTHSLVAVLCLVFLTNDQTLGGSVSVVSNATDWRESTEFIDFNTNDQPWAGVPSLPNAATFTITPTIGGFANHIDNVPGTQNVLAQRGVRYFRSVFTLPSFDAVTADLQISVDNDVHIFINGSALALEAGESVPGENFDGGVHHRLFVAANGLVTNGYLGGQAFDSFTSTFPSTNWNVGANDVVLAVRNDSPPKQFGDLGGFSFRMDLETQTNAVPEPSSFVLAGLGMLGLGAARCVRSRRPVRDHRGSSCFNSRRNNTNAHHF